MMRFPALLFAKLEKARVARIFRLAPARQGGMLAFVDPAEVLHLGSAHPVSHEKIRDIIATAAPAIWIGGSEPLDHPGIAHLVRALAPSGHAIFLETNGVLLRRRVHEFQPLPRVFVVVRLDARRKSEFDFAVEGLRAAGLSGFYTAIHSVVDEGSDVGELERLRDFLLEKDVDGWLITGASAANPAVAARTAEARALIPSAAWRRFSVLVERELLAEKKATESQKLAVGGKPQGEACEESVNVA
jgi:hypothetical protein